MLQIYKDLELDIPSDVTVEIHARNIKVTGPRGELEKVSFELSRSSAGGEWVVQRKVKGCTSTGTRLQVTGVDRHRNNGNYSVVD